MERDAIHELTGAYALDALDGDEERAYEEHLARCPACQEELAQLRETVSLLAYVPEGPAPPPALGERILTRAREERGKVIPLRTRGAVIWTSAGAAAVAAVVALGLGIWAASLNRSLDRESEATRILANPARTAALRGASGRLAVGSDGKAVLVVQGLAAAPKGKDYEIWIIHGKQPLRAGLFDGGEAEDVVLTRTVPKGAEVAVTVEREGGVDAPTTKPIFATSRT